MKVLVIGGTGLVGTTLVEMLCKEGHDVIVTSRGRTQPHLKQNIPVIKINRKDTLGFRRHFRGMHFDAIYDCIAFTPRDVILIAELFQKPTRYIFLSTAAVYGELTSRNILETHPPNPIDWHDYGRNKSLAEQEILKFPHLHYTIIRPTIVYGPGDRQEPRASYFFRHFHTQIPILIPGKAEVLNNYIYVKDLGTLLLKSLEADSNIILNAGGPEIFNWPQYLKTLSEVMNQKLPPCEYKNLSLKEFRENKEYRKLQFHHNAFHDFVLNLDRAKSIGWTPNYFLEQGLKETWKWLKENKNFQ